MLQVYRFGAAVLLITATAFTQQVPVTSQPAPLALGQPYVDGSFGFTVTPPAGGATLKQKHFLDKADLEIVQFVNVDANWSLSVRLTTTTQTLDAATIIDGITANLNSQFTGVKVISAQPQRIADHDGVRYSASFVADGREWLRQQAVIQTKPTEYYALVFATLLSARDQAVPLFDKVVASFQLLRTPAIEKRIEEGLKNGKRLLDSAATGEIQLAKRLRKDHYLRFVVDRKELGFVEIMEQPRQEGKRTLVDIREWAWLFQPDGSIVHMRHDMSLAADLSSERWENRVITLLPEQKDKPRRALLNFDSGIRQDNQLLVAYMPQPNAPELRDKAIEVEPSYASAAWHALLPRIVNLKKPELYAFSSYNAERRGLVLRAFEVIGPTQLTLAGVSTRAIKLEDSEGLIPPKNEIDVDDNGKILRVVAGNLEMLATDRQYAESTYGARVKEAMEALKKIPIREPVPARRERPVKPDAPTIGQPPPPSK